MIMYLISKRLLSSVKVPRIAHVVIGDEILNGRVLDTNTQFLAQTLYTRGVTLERVETVPDRESAIAEVITRLDKTFEYVFTSGGIGPTHDDITYNAIAKAYNLELKYHNPTIEKMKEANVSPLNEDRLRMALLPHPCKVIYTKDLWVPLVIVNEKTWILPGVPRIYRNLINGSIEHLPKGPTAIHQKLVYSRKKEGDIAKALKSIQQMYPDLMIGSYPEGSHPSDFVVCFSIQGRNESHVKEATEMILAHREIEALPERPIISKPEIRSKD